MSPPELYGEKPRKACGEICEKRDTFEQRLFTQALEQDKPMLGICRGIQFFNAFLGGAVASGVFLPHRRKQPEDLFRVCCGGL